MIEIVATDDDLPPVTLAMLVNLGVDGCIGFAQASGLAKYRMTALVS